MQYVLLFDYFPINVLTSWYPDTGHSKTGQFYQGTKDQKILNEQLVVTKQADYL
jgi:hypothetical protein